MSELRRLPWKDDGRTAYATMGDGIVNTMADVYELEILVGASRDAERAEDLARLADTSKAELRIAVTYLAHALRDAVDVATMRGERLAAPASARPGVLTVADNPDIIGPVILEKPAADDGGR
ncbi:hypothetical protein SRB5_04570 [Streptomyces sp. RB5]|uniref:Uncharacterized protein n=1 Tax=Streptomyces smaragdinus TaxID=2585196 RepID=A0A7K0CA73_9ACTN|nr:hypothetical protein [Streptomyces smaragdinus]MQY10350.1 hypothetical protein [Streptomyces smaragdinus]